MAFNTLLCGAVLALLATVAAFPEPLQQQEQQQQQQQFNPSQPQPVSNHTVDDVRFLLFTRNNPDEEQVIVFEDLASLVDSHLNPSDPTMILIHGFGGCCGWPIPAKNELLKYGAYNVLVVDWGKLAAQPWYNIAYKSVPLTGERIARLLEWMQDEVGLDVTKIQAVGHSLGAHLAGFIGKNLQRFTLPYITGMDPAGPGYENINITHRLNPDDADFVMIMHTNGGSIPQGCVGMWHSVGHVDFYPNGGVHQPGCTIGGGWTDLLVGGCSHGRAHDYWIESINGDIDFVARQCERWEDYHNGTCTDCGEGCGNMGFHADTSLRGTYFLGTARRSPFALG